MPDKDKREVIKEMEIKKDVGDVVAYVSSIFKQAIAFDASDIHIEPMEHFLLVRFRQDGDFHLIDKI
jgi:type II secretory ATPase GspE/PulE/Tfp pilus assembly ATPase PilB-like protein